jgi:hypothetical protein
MNSFLKELNPLYDMDRARLNPENLATQSNLELALNVVTDRAIMQIKPLVRGGLVGAGLGALVGSGSNDFDLYLNAGIFSGIAVDVLQTFVRLGYYCLNYSSSSCEKQ